MPVATQVLVKKLAAIATLCATASLLGCAQSPPAGPVSVDGSSTVFPITEAIAKAYNQAQGDQVKVVAATSGTGGGFKKFCAGETDINDASRPINQEEMKLCDQAGVRYVELPIAFDALTVVVNPKNTWAEDITVAELKTMWEPAAQAKITNWQQVRSSWPKQPLRLFGPGKDSGTFDYFTEVIVGGDGSRTDYVASEDDNTLVQGVGQDPNALGYFGFAYYEAQGAKLKAVAIDGGKGPVLPSRATVEKAQYQPLARPLFIYVNAKAAQDKPQVQSYVEFYLKNAPQVVSTVGYIPLSEDGYRLATIHFERGKVGTVFGGQPQPDLTLAELLRKQATF
ncbi:MAG: PstS family phosphate ABC transporter substrate-binding protein [Aphanocapsa sp. GSE-SYN-MK-11-07L]|jgi:phosphate transport system substrate-binding protein|nr:PstS family phosphate ABC transporter substrate-binding protein [Aphanocapsa sp. GSE-SYN-MK-11-07L]